MSVLRCPECNEIVSQFADTCPKCGFPIKSFLDEHNIQLQNFLLCPKCANGDCLYNFDEYCPPYIKCKYCGEIIVETNRNKSEMKKIRFNENERYENICINMAKSLNTFDQIAYDERLEEEHNEHLKTLERINQKYNPHPNTPHCPVCNSTNIEKISIGKKAKGSFLFGILSSDVRKQMHCKDCGYKF